MRASLRSTPPGLLAACRVGGLLAGMTASPLVFGAAPALASELVAGSPQVISADRPSAPHVEPHLSAHPTDADVLLAAAVTFYGAGSLRDGTSDAFVSTDGGRAWRRHRLDDCSVDPWTGFGPEGTMYVSCMAKDGGTTLVYRSSDAGESFEGPVTVPRGDFGPVDHPVFVVDRSAGAGRGDLWVGNGQSFPAPGLDHRVYGLTVSRSTDGGRSFAAPVPAPHDNVQQQPIDAVALADGTPLFLVGDYAVATPRGQELLGRRRTWLVGAGDAPALPLLVDEQEASELPWRIAAGAGPGGEERLYVVIDGWWTRTGLTHDEIGDRQDSTVEIVHSDDRGWTWSAPVVVNGGPARANRELPTVAVAPDGSVGVGWIDTRASRNGECWDAYFAASSDGGESFSDERRVSDRTSCPFEAEAQRGVAQRWRYGGDYSGLTATADGDFVLLWSGIVEGWFQLLAARIEVADETPRGDAALDRSPKDHRSAARRSLSPSLQQEPRR